MVFLSLKQRHLQVRNLNYLLDQTKDLDEFVFFNNSEEPYEKNCPHGFSLTLRDETLNGKKFYDFLQENSINCKRNFGSMPTQHSGFEFLGYKPGEFPEAEYVGNNGVHIGCHQDLNKNDLDYTVSVLHDYFKKI